MERFLRHHLIKENSKNNILRFTQVTKKPYDLLSNLYVFLKSIE